MPLVEDQIQALVDLPSEKLSVELKPWIDPLSRCGQSIIAKAALALRNQSGGFLLIGFDDNGFPLPLKDGLDVREAFHVDKIQEIVSRYASKPFLVEVHFRQRDGVEHPVIQVESGIKTPVVCKADLKDENGRKHLSVNEIYVRTLNANGVASSSKIQGNDFEDLIERCFQNREADHAAFLSKLIRSASKSDIQELISVISEGYQAAKVNPGAAELIILDYGQSRFKEEAAERGVDLSGLAFVEGVLRIEGSLKKYTSSNEFLQFLHSANPSLTGWPIWLTSQHFSDEKVHPYTYQNTWEQFIQVPGYFGHHLDFMIFNPKDDFYFVRALEDDTHKQKAAPEAPKTVEPIIQLHRVAETLAVGKAFASVLGDPPEKLKLFFAFRWSGVKNRQLIGWTQHHLDIGTNTPSHQDGVMSFVELSPMANEQEIAEKTKEAVDPLTIAFGGYEVEIPFIQKLVSKLLQRRL
jgi:hypothetical protein